MASLLKLRTLLPVAALATLLPCLAQAQACVPGSAQATLESGNIKTRFLNGGDMFWNLSDARFEVPKGSGKHTIFAGSVWFGGIEAGTNYVHVSSQTYRQGGQVGFWPGPINPGVTTNSQTCTGFNFIAPMTAQLISDFQDRVLQGVPIPEADIAQQIKDWPAKGNPFRSNISSMGMGQLAPFIDVDSDGMYDPRNGDMPYILGDQAVFAIMNDAGGTKQPASPAAGIEMHVMMYGFNAPASTDVQNTIFVRYNFINRGTKTLTDAYFGQWADLDLGNYADDFVGSDVGRDMYYAYNGDNDDEGPDGYGPNPPSQGVMFLNVPMTNFMMYHNNASPVNGNPTDAADYYHYLQSKWRNGNAITYGGDGTSGSTPASHMLDGDPVAGTGWTELSAGNTPGDRRGLGAHGPFTFAPNDILTFDVAFPFARGSSNLGSITQLQQAADNIRQFYANGLVSAPGTVASPLALQLYPNPTEGAVHAQLSADAAGEATFTLRDLTGRTVLQEKALLPAGPSQHRLQLQHLPKGLYLLQVQRGTGSQTVKVLKQ